MDTNTEKNGNRKQETEVVLGGVVPSGCHILHLQKNRCFQFWWECSLIRETLQASTNNVTFPKHLHHNKDQNLHEFFYMVDVEFSFEFDNCNLFSVVSFLCSPMTFLFCQFMYVFPLHNWTRCKYDVPLWNLDTCISLVYPYTWDVTLVLALYQYFLGYHFCTFYCTNPLFDGVILAFVMVTVLLIWKCAIG